MLKMYVCEDVAIQRKNLRRMLQNIIVMEEMDMEIVVAIRKKRLL